MTRILDVKVPSNVREVLPDDAYIAFEPQVPVDSQGSSYVWYRGDDPQPIASALVEKGLLDSAEIVDAYQGDWLIRIEWSGDLWAFNECVRQFDGAILSNEFTDGWWNVRLRFPSARAISGFNTNCADHGVSLKIQRIIEPEQPTVPGDPDLTAKQREALTLALEHGYFDIPRSVTTSELASLIEISDQALIERLRRGLVRMLEQTLHQ